MKSARVKTTTGRLLCCGVAIAGALWGGQAAASEGGASVYLLGSGGPGAAVLPPLQGVFFATTQYYYKGEAEAGRTFVVGGNVVGGLEATVNANFSTLLWVPTTDIFGGGTLALGAVVPIGGPNIDVSAVLTGPRGNQFSASRNDSAFVVGDPLLLGMLGWKMGELHVTASTLLNIPVGDYREDRLANLAFHRWATDFSLAATWQPEATGWDVSGKVGLTANGENDHTNYTTGTEFHAEGAIEKKFNESWSAGVQAYHFEQISGDSGSGARLGPFKGKVTGVGATAAYNFLLFGKAPATLRLHAITEFDAENRLEGNSVFLDFSMPLHVKMPPGAEPH